MFNEATLGEVRKLGTRARAQIRDRKSQPARDLSAGVQAFEASAAAFAFGCAQGRSGSCGMVDLWTGAALHAFSFLSGDDSGVAAHARALGTGALAACAYRHGVVMGERARLSSRGTAVRPASTTVAGAGTVAIELTVARLTVTARR